MPSEVADLFVILNAVTDPFARGLKGAAAEAETQSKRMSSALGTVVKAGLGIGAAAVAVGVASVKMASTFQSTMETLHTQAGVAQDQIASLSSGVLSLAGQVGFAPNSLAEALYHIESSFASTGITGQRALELLQVAAEGAATGHADLVDVTNALDAAVVSGIPGVQNLNDAMGELNATVGSGDMSMQDLANAFSTGLLANVKSYGLTFRDVGAALAVFGDNNMRGQIAATDLRMAVQAMAKPAATASVELAKMGLDADSLAKTMSTGGLLPALQLLHERMTKIGVTAKDQGAVLTDLFGKKAGAGIVVLYDQLDRLESKYPELSKGASGFADAWQQTKNTFSQQIKEIESGAEGLAVRLGEFLIPQLSKLITLGQRDLGQVASGFTGAALKPVQHSPAHSAFMNQELAAPSLTRWQQFGQEVHHVLAGVEDGAKRLEPIGKDFIRFGDDVWQGLGKIEHAAEPVAHDLGVSLYVAVASVGKIFADVLGPGIKGVADFIDDHRTTFRIFADVVLGGLALKMGVLGSINATKGLIDLAAKIMQFPTGQVGEITTAWSGMKAAWTGKEAAEGEAAVQGLAGAFGTLKSKASGVLDAVLPNSGDLAGIARMGKDFDGISLGAQHAGEQLSLFETTEKGVVQVAEQQQLALFDEDLGNIETTAGNASVTLNRAETAAGGLAGKLGKFALAGGVIGGALIGLGFLASELGKLAGVGDHTGIAMETLQTKFELISEGSTGSQQDIANFAVAMAAMSNVMGKPVQGLTDIDNQMAQLVKSGDMQQAQSLFAQIATELQKQGIDAQGAASKFPAYEQALKDAGSAAQTMGGHVQDAINAMEHQQALDQFKSDVANLTDTINTNGKALSGNSVQAQQNISAFRNLTLESLQLWKSQTDAHAPVDQVNHDLAQQYLALENVATQFLGSKQKADDFLKSLGMIKPAYSTSIGLDTDPAVRELHGLLQTINTSYGTVHVSVNTTGLGLGTSRGAGTPSWGDGGWVDAPAGHPVAGIVHGKEYVLSQGMLAGRRPIDPQVLSGLGVGSAGYTRNGDGAAAGSVTYVENHFHIAGSVIAEQQLMDLVQTNALQYSGRNSANGLSYTRVP